jgi:hypothetical protein
MRVFPPLELLGPENGLDSAPVPDGCGPAPVPGEGQPFLRPSSPNWSNVVRLCLLLRTSKASDICKDKYDVIRGDGVNEKLTCLNICVASSLPSFLSGCHFKACDQGT